jgi:hypothetical protein
MLSVLIWTYFQATAFTVEFDFDSMKAKISFQLSQIEQ